MLAFLIFVCSAILAGSFVLFLFFLLAGWYDSDVDSRHKDSMQYNSKAGKGEDKWKRK